VLLRQSLYFYYAQSTRSVAHEKCPQKDADTPSFKIDEFLKEIREDQSNFCRNQPHIQLTFMHYLQFDSFALTNQADLTAVLQLLSLYPSFRLSNANLLAIYKIVCFNMHTKSV
jgi:hypothetical protein